MASKSFIVVNGERCCPWHGVKLEKGGRCPYLDSPQSERSESNTYTSVNGELRLNYRDDPQSW